LVTNACALGGIFKEEITMAEEIQSFILHDNTAKQMVQFADKLAKEIHSDVTTSQIRNVYGTVKKLEMLNKFDEKEHRQLLLLKPKLAYARGKVTNEHKRESFKKLEQALGYAIDAVSTKDAETFKRFCNFFEAILAYHKAHGGKSS
jgi:CRISPR-associated protein Csm2